MTKKKLILIFQTENKSEFEEEHTHCDYTLTLSGTPLTLMPT